MNNKSGKNEAQSLSGRSRLLQPFCCCCFFPVVIRVVCLCDAIFRLLNIYWESLLDSNYTKKLLATLLWKKKKLLVINSASRVVSIHVSDTCNTVIFSLCIITIDSDSPLFLEQETHALYKRSAANKSHQRGFVSSFWAENVNTSASSHLYACRAHCNMCCRWRPYVFAHIYAT